MQLLISTLTKPQITPFPVKQTVKDTWSSLSQLKLTCTYTDTKANCSQHIYDNFKFYEKLLYVRKAPLTEQQYKDKAQTSVLTSVSLEVESSKEDYNIQTIDESYTLNVSSTSITLKTKNNFGAARAFATLVQLLDVHPSLPEDHQAYALYHAEIEDRAAYPWRELLVDGSRHYMSIKHLKHQIDALSISKFNILHFHVIDDESFPLKFSKAPQSDLVKGAYNAKKYYYSIKDIQELQKYAFQRGVLLYLEFEVPGHAFSWRHADASLVAKCYDDSDVYRTVSLNPINEKVFTIIKGALEELINDAHFAEFHIKPVIHLGGDEVDVKCWEQDPQIAKYVKDNNLTFAQMWMQFQKRVNNIVKELGVAVTPVYWEETFLHGNEIIPGSIIQAWTGSGFDNTKRLKIVQAGHKMISSQGWYLPRMKPTGTGHQFFQDTWEDFYKIDIASGMSDEQKKNVLGGGPCMWGEGAWGLLDSEDQRIWPRSVAIAEVLWSNPKSRDTPRSLRERIEAFSCKLYQGGIKAGVLVEFKPCFGYPLK